MHYYLDGYNFLFRNHDDDRRSLEQSRERFIQQVHALARSRQHPITIVFDAGQAPGIISRLREDNVEIIYSSEGEDADNCLLDLVEREKTPGRVTLVTSDRLLKRRALELGVKTMSVESFLKHSHRWDEEEENEHPLKEGLGDGRTLLFDHYLKIFEERDKQNRECD